ncbi:MAG: hypothetical protein M3345_02665 [Actinomycetota bacterium]|nr:hypothetical protein [Actinomycetota bacterium]
MKKRFLLAALVACLIGALVAPPGTAVAKGKKKSGPVVVGKDEAGDWGVDGPTADNSLNDLGDALGQDLVEASIAMADKATVNFVIKVNSLPPSGGVPEFSRYNWDFLIDGEAFQLTGGFTEYLRGVCYPLTSNTCPPPRDPGSTPFFIRQGACVVAAPPDCTEVGLVHAAFDAGAGTITIPVPLEAIGGKPGSKITAGASSMGAPVYAAPAALISQANLPKDLLTVTGTFVVPKK